MQALIFDWDLINRGNLSEFMLNQETVLSPFGVALEYFIMYGDKIFVQEPEM